MKKKLISLIFVIACVIMLFLNENLGVGLDITISNLLEVLK